MENNEIIKALECCFAEKGTKQTCGECPYHKFGELCKVKRDKDALDLINRQQETIETLRNCVKQHHIIRQDDKSPLSLLAAEIKAEEIKEFAERLKEKAHTQPIFDTYCGNKYMGDVSKVYVADIDNLVKEMVGEE